MRQGRACAKRSVDKLTGDALGLGITIAPHGIHELVTGGRQCWRAGGDLVQKQFPMTSLVAGNGTFDSGLRSKAMAEIWHRYRDSGASSRPAGLG